MNESTENSKSVSNVVGWVLGIPLVVIILILSSPWILYTVVIQEPLDKRKIKKFIRAHDGLVVLFITTSSKYSFIDFDFRESLRAGGIHRVVMFDGTKSNDKFDEFNLNKLINRHTGFPQLIVFKGGKMTAISLKDDFSVFFRKEIDKVQLIGSIVWKLRH